MPSNRQVSTDEDEQTLVAIDGSPPDLFNPPKGCAYHPRCPYAMRVCAERTPPVEALGTGHHTQCWLHHEQAGALPVGLTSSKGISK
jgi:oligopeptide/dipeptide ABC transporter ATP-binding protein